MSSLPKNVKVQWFPVLVFSALFICFFTACHLYYANQYDRIRATIHEELSSIADLKVQQISNWRQERIRDIQLFASNPSFAEYVRPGENVQLKKEILSLMRSALKLHGYQNLMIADTQGSPRLSAIEESWTPPDPALIQKALTGGRPVLGDLTRAAGSDSIYLDIVAPLLQSDGSSAPAGLMVVRIDPHQFLYPYIQTWPSPSPSAETLLLRREGDTIIYLNELRHRKNTALSLRESIQDKELPAARILRGETGVEEMIDYRGAPVLAAARPVPDTPWCMVAKVDTQEIFEPLRRQALTATLVLGLLVLGAALFVWGLGGRRRSEELLRASHMQAELRAEQEKMLAAFKSIDDGIYIINRQYRLEYINPAMEIRFGPIDGRTCYQYFNGLDHACPWCRQEAVLADGTARWEWYHKKFQRHFDTMATPIENPDGSISVLHILRDVTGTKQSAEALQESEDKFRCCVEQSHDGIVLCDTEGKVVEWNRELERITQLPHDEAIGKYIWDVNYAVMPDETKSAAVHQKHKEMVQGIFSTGDNLLDIQPFEMFFQRPDGERTHVQNILFPIKTRNAFMWGGICRDITEKKQTNDALLASEARLKSSQQLAHLGDWEFNVTTGEIYWSDELYRLLEYSPGEIAPSFKSGIKSVHPDDRRTMLHAAAYRGTDPRKDEYRMVLRNGSLRYIYSEIWVVADSAGKPVLARGILQDITLHKMIEKELSRHHDKLDELVMVRTAKLEEEMLERMKTEKELRESEAQFRALAETSPDAVVMTDLYMNILYWNTAAEKIFGFSRQEMLGRQPDCLMVPAARERQAAAIKDIVATGHSPFLNGFTETVALKKDGSEFPCELAVFQWETEDQFFLGVILRDITERKRAEEALRQSQERYRGMLNAITTYTYSVEVEDRRDVSVRHSQGCFAVTGYQPADYDENPLLWHTMIHPDDRGMVEKALAAMHEGRNTPPLEHRIIKSGGSTVWVRNTMVPYRDENSRLFRYDGIIENITERKLAEEALRTSEEKLDGILSAVTEYMLMVDEEFSIVWANEHAMETFGKDIVGRKCHEAYHGYAAPCDGCSARDCFATGRPAEHEQVIITPDGRELNVWCTTSVAARYENGKPRHLIYIAHDITERKMLQAEAMRTSHLASIGELAAGVAHEINNPINGIINCADILKHQFEKKGEDADIPGRIIKEGERVARIVKNLLTFAREQKGKTEPQNISDIYADAFALLSKQLEKDFILTRQDFPEGLPRVLAQPQQIQQVCINLLSNARYALNKKYPDRDPCKQLNVTAQAVMFDDQPYVRIIFHDQGTGVSESDLEKLCNPFFSTKPAGEGTGLGLSISYNIIKDHGGRMLFETSEGEYMRVMVDLPTAAT